ncbi:MAG TPA: hypothetical protein VGD60_09660 [Candidatus Acidoferrales bacterium]
MSMETNLSGHGAPNHGGSDNYEKTDANVGSVAKGGMWLAVLLIVVFVAMRFTFNAMSEMTPMGDAASPLESSREMPPAPRLQVYPQMELSDYCDGQVQSLEGYSWKDSKAGIVQIPVDRAIDLMVEHPLPARAAGAVPAGVNAQVPMTPPAADVTGQCGYTAARDEAQRKAAEEGGKESGK